MVVLLQNDRKATNRVGQAGRYVNDDSIPASTFTAPIMHTDRLLSHVSRDSTTIKADVPNR